MEIMRIRFLVFLSILLAGYLAPRPGEAELPSPTEYEVKAAFLYNLAKFIEWPRGTLMDPATPFNIGVLGESSMFEALSAISEKTIKDHRLNVQHLTTDSKLDSCHILFIDRTILDVDPILSQLQGSKTLTVGESIDFNQKGGLVNFIIIDNHIGFEINQKRAERAGFMISSKLLSLARITINAR